MAEAELSQDSSSVSSYESSNFDVFVSYNWTDTGNNFTSILHKILKDNGIDAFKDNETLRTGEAIGSTLQGVIERSKIWIPVFSSGYGDSEWCLRELAQIVRCHKSDHRLILPIFCHVNPYDVQNQTGSFKKAFQEHEKKFESNIINIWKEALKFVGGQKGEVLNKERNQAELVEAVIKRVLDELIGGTNLAECKCPIGLDSSVKDIRYLLNIGSNNIWFVGICGFGGIGKTIIAKAVYNSCLSTFTKNSFLSDIREKAMQCMGLVSLQKQLLTDIFQSDFNIHDVHKGKEVIEQRLRKEKVLVVLDDVDSREQVNALIGEHNWFGRGSRVIITTRDEHFLNVAKVDEIYKPQVLDGEQSLQLFSWHAFQKVQPPKDYMQLSQDVSHYSGGLPLTLEVLGSYLSDIRNKNVWECTLKKLENIPDDEVQRRLKISYDNLKDDYQKAIFLDATCFFIGWKKETVISIWEACDYHPNSTIDGLIKRSLLKFDEFSNLRMHDQIRDMGREIVRQESPTNPGKRSRLWSYGDISKVLEEHKGTGKIIGMSFPYDFSNHNLASETFEKMKSLKFLDIDSTKFMGDFSHLPSTLRCLKWNFCPLTIIPSKFYPNRLVSLDLSVSYIKQAWNVKPQDDKKVFKYLKVLNLNECENLSESPNFSWFPHLEQLDLECCISLKMLDESIGQLSQLKYLNLKNCALLEKLPNGLGQLENLQVLDAMRCRHLKELPRSMGGMKSLRMIYLKYTSISKFPDDFSMLVNLMGLSVGSMYLQSLPKNMSSLKNLEQLFLYDCSMLKELPKLPSSLVELYCYDCFTLDSLPNLSVPKKLKTISLQSCQKLKEIQGLEGTQSLEYLGFEDNFKLTHSPRRIHGQGKLLSNNPPEDIYPLTIADGIYNTRLILCLVVKPDNLIEKNHAIIDTNICVSIHQKEEIITCVHFMRFEKVKFNCDQETILIHHFKGFDWFGIPLQGKDSIEILAVLSYDCEIAFWKLLYDSKEPEQNKPNEETSALMVADFFKWSCVSNEASPSDSIDEIDSHLLGKRGRHGEDKAEVHPKLKLKRQNQEGY